MASCKKLEIVNQAIQALKEGQKDENDHLLFSRLLSELESLKGDSKLEQSESSAKEEEVNSPAIGEMESKNVTGSKVESCSREIGTEEIVKELRQVRKQNVVTQCVLSVMIVLTVAWQLSEVSLILKVKDGLTHPFRSFGSMLSGTLKPRGMGARDAEKQETEVVSAPIHVPIPALKMPNEFGSSVE